MTTYTLMRIGHMVATIGIMLWVIPAFVGHWKILKDGPVRAVLATIRNELTLFIWPMMLAKFFTSVAMNAHEGDSFSVGPSIIFILDVFNWWVYRKSEDDDDRWKKRGKKLAEKVSVTADGKLAVVPQ